MALNRKNRLSRKDDIIKTVRFGKKIGKECFLIHFLKSDKPFSKLAVIIPKKVEKRASARNKYRRQITEIMRTIFSKTKKHMDFVIKVGPEIKNKNFQELKASIEAALVLIEK